MTLAARPQTALFVLTDSEGRQYGVDITTSQTFTDRYIVTKHPVEEGAEVSDNIQKQEATISITGEISNSPLHLSEEPDPRRGVTTYELLRRIADDGRTVSLATPVRSYRELAFTDLKVERGSDISSETLRISISLIEIRRAKTLITSLAPSLFAEDVRDSATEEAASSGDTEPWSPCQLDIRRSAGAALVGGAAGADFDELDQCRTELNPEADEPLTRDELIAQLQAFNVLPPAAGGEPVGTGESSPLMSPDERIDWSAIPDKSGDIVGK